MNKDLKTEEEVVNETEETAEETEVNSADDELSKITAEKDEILDKYQRLAAEFDNYKKRTIKERDMTTENAKANTVKEFLPVLDSLTQANHAIEESEDGPLKQGFELVSRQIFDALVKIGVEKIETENAPFNPDLHEAVMHVEDESVGEGIIVEEFRTGYKLGDKVLRHSMVKVAN